MNEALDIRVKGIVQGVGFRPFVYRLAKRNLITGWVLNGRDGVFIHAEGESSLLDAFVMGIVDDAPAAAHVSEVTLDEVPLQDCETFEIRTSDKRETAESTLVSPDLAVCDDCLREMFDPSDRRYRYPFINCTNCGPRFTLIESLPYDRAATSMKRFAMCPACASEYGNPLNRRFHAQPDACFECGPSISLSLPKENAKEESCFADAAAQLARKDGGCPNGWDTRWARDRQESDALLAETVSLLIQGGIVALKSLGGFHLACDAQNEQAVQALRSRKQRDGRAFAVMVADTETARRFCSVSEDEERVLESVQRPIVLLQKRPDAALSQGLADALPELGVMLPSTPLQYLLMADFVRAGGCMLVMTSGNVHDEPIVIDDGEAHRTFVGIADAIVGNNRAILRRFDDSVVRVIRFRSQTGTESAVQMIRRARGFAPQPIEVPQNLLPGVRLDGGCMRGDSAEDTAAAPAGDAVQDALFFAAGPEQKNTFTFLRGRQAFVSPHKGDLEDAAIYDAWLESLEDYRSLFAFEPTCVVSDEHPAYLSTQWAEDASRSQGLRLMRVQHHHAHVVAVMAENALTDAVCGIAFDGSGYGADGMVWGGEVLLANTFAFERFANFSYVPLPGGAAAIKNPARMAYGVLWAFDLLGHPAAQDVLRELGPQADVCQAMIDSGVNTPMTSSVGRLFDAASSLLGLCSQATYEGEPAVLLEAALWSGLRGAAASADCEAERSYRGAYDSADALLADAYGIDLVKNSATETSTAQDTSVVLFDAARAFEQLLDDKAAGCDTALIARRFHNGFVGAILTAARCIETLYGIRTVVLSGGVFMNRYVLEASVSVLQENGFIVALGKELPPNDGGISFGQAVIAAAKTLHASTEKTGTAVSAAR